MDKYLKDIVKESREEIIEIINDFCSERDIDPSEFMEIFQSIVDSDEYN